MQGIPHLRNFGAGVDMRLSTRCGPDYVVVHGVPQHCKRLLEDMVKPVPGFEHIKFYNPQSCNTTMAVLVFANRAGNLTCSTCINMQVLCLRVVLLNAAWNVCSALGSLPSLWVMSVVSRNLQ